MTKPSRRGRPFTLPREGDIWNRPLQHERLLLKLRAHHPRGGVRVVLRPAPRLGVRFGEPVVPGEGVR